MSRYSLKPLPHRADVFEVAVGWDAGLNTYFAIVFGAPDMDGDPEIASWSGCQTNELLSLISLLMVTRRFALITYPIALRLIADRRARRGGSSWVHLTTDLAQLIFLACSYLSLPMRSKRGKSLSSSARDGVGRTFP